MWLASERGEAHPGNRLRGGNPPPPSPDSTPKAFPYPNTSPNRQKLPPPTAFTSLVTARQYDVWGGVWGTMLSPWQATIRATRIRLVGKVGGSTGPESSLYRMEAVLLIGQTVDPRNSNGV